MSNDWILDFLVSFLKSPPWTVPLNNFIDQNCHLFDTEDENKFSYTEVHQRYQETVENLLTFHLDELGLTAEQFVEACAAGRVLI